ncbi:MAG: hypothetical protein HZB38_15620 [Planctomycetes bacterium]|nr:hypothetical protein [Planctomycetota bacterium]
MVFKVEREIGGNVLSIETGKLARQAAGSVIVRCGDNLVLGTVVTGPPREGIDFFPLTVDYREKMSAAGKFPGGFFKREGRPTTKEILTMRMIDRPLRPLFPEGFMDEVQIQVFVLSADTRTDPDTLAIVAGAAAVAVSQLPVVAPIAGVRVGRVDGQFILNPNIEEREQSDLDVVVAGHTDAVNMIEVGAKELPEDVIYDAIRFAHENGVIPICEMLAELRKHAGKPVTWEKPETNASLFEQIKKKAWDELVADHRVVLPRERGRTRAHAAGNQGHARKGRRAGRPHAHFARRRAARRAQARPDPPARLRGRLAAADARVGPLLARRDAGDGFRDAGNRQ